MAATLPKVGDPVFLPKEGLADLVRLLQAQGYTVVAPVARDGVIMARPIDTAADIARGWRDEQSGGRYRLREGDPEMYFEHVIGPDGPKRYFMPPVQRLFKMHIEGEQMVLDAGPPQPPKLALLGVRPCELAAIAVQDRVYGAEPAAGTFRCESETYYQETRRNALIVAVNCTRPGGTCFCVSMGTGPEARAGFDLCLTELRAGFVMTAASPRGGEVLAALPTRAPSAAELELAELKVAQAREHMGREMDPSGLPELLTAAIEHPRWAEVAKRCLSCGNCTMVCPTCFCSTVTDGSDLDGKGVTRTRQWESCFTHQFSYTTAGPVRNTIRGRYRHWLRHKLGTWWEQFGTSGCVGCGRCITWCPVGIDLTEEIAAIRHDQRASVPPASTVAVGLAPMAGAVAVAKGGAR